MGDHNTGPEPYHPSYEAPTTPFQRVVLPADETVRIPRPLPPLPPLPPPPPPKRRLGDVSMKTAYLVGAILVTVLAVVLVFTLFSGDKPKAVGISQSGAASESVPGSDLPPVPAGVPLAALPGTATKVVGTVSDKKSKVEYPRLGKPWKLKSYAPFTIAQRSGKVAQPHTMIASAMLPGATPAKPSSEADYRALAARAAQWAVRTQFPADSDVTWNASQKLATGTGWVLGFEVSYGDKTSQAVVAVVEVGKTKPAMVLATIPDSGKDHWRDLNTLVEGLRPL
ncbi:hypothetical protein ACIBG8_22510 [Nonomuraea sp. NPDC050556]|uniref:hypothetical protein n=1 Tax=Nonomuraea sp. NPDC050556 TaxID=3364369 RepID=UPI00378B13DB